MKITISRELGKRLAVLLCDLLLVMAAALIAHGFALAWRPLGFIVGGSLLGFLTLALGKTFLRSSPPPKKANP